MNQCLQNPTSKEPPPGMDTRFSVRVKARILCLIWVGQRLEESDDAKIFTDQAVMPVRKRRSELFHDWHDNMGFEVPYVDSMEGMYTNKWLILEKLLFLFLLLSLYCVIARSNLEFCFVDYKPIGRMGEGTFSEVLKCQSVLDGKLYACKKMKQKYDR